MDNTPDTKTAPAKAAASSTPAPAPRDTRVRVLQGPLRAHGFTFARGAVFTTTKAIAEKLGAKVEEVLG